jgi:hypothetical protein
LTAQEAELIRTLPTVRDVNIGEYTNGPASLEGVKLKSVDMTSMSPSWTRVMEARSLQGATSPPWSMQPGPVWW